MTKNRKFKIDDTVVDFNVDQLIEMGFKIVREGDTGYLELTDEDDYLNSPALVTDDFLLTEGNIGEQVVRVYKIGQESEGSFDLYRINKFKRLLALRSITGQ